MRAVSAADGSFRLDHLAYGEYKLTAGLGGTHAPYVIEDIPLRLEPGETRQIDMVASEGAVLEVVVKDPATGAAVKAAQVYIRAADYNGDLSITTGDDGTGWLRLTPGEYTLDRLPLYSAPDLERTPVGPFKLSDGETRRVEFPMSDPAGAPSASRQPPETDRPANR
jgi:hypothetical protein